MLDNIVPLLAQVPIVGIFIWFVLEFYKRQSEERRAFEQEWIGAMKELKNAVMDLRTSLGAIIERQLEIWRTNNGHFEAVLAQERQIQESVLKTLCTLTECISQARQEAYDSHSRQQEQLAELVGKLSGPSAPRRSSRS